MDLGAEFLNEEQVRGKVKVMGGRSHCVGGDFIDADFSYGLESVDGVDSDKIFMCLREIELVGIGKTESVLRTCFFEAW